MGSFPHHTNLRDRRSKGKGKVIRARARGRGRRALNPLSFSFGRLPRKLAPHTQAYFPNSRKDGNLVFLK